MGESMFDFVLSVEDRISKSKIVLRRNQPFFSYLIEHLSLKKENSIPTMGVNAKGKLHYNEKFVESLSDEHLSGVLVHEVMHVALRHMARGKDRTATVNGMPLFNIACDIQVNDIILQNGFSLPDDAILPSNDEVTFGPVTIKNISSKASEEIYDELLAQFKQKAQNGEDGVSFAPGNGSGDEGENQQEVKYDGKLPEGFDEHLSDDGENSSGTPEDKLSEKQKDIDWSKALSEAYTYAKMQGKEPGGFKRIFSELHKSKVNWRALLRNTIASAIPIDYTYSRPNKKYIAHDLYLPAFYGESIKVICTIDTSGSISEQDLSSFMSELIGISETFNDVDFIVLTHDVDVHDEYAVSSRNKKELLSIQLNGGGGTSHIPVFEYIEKQQNKWDLDSTIVVSFTDGYSDFPEKKPRVDQVIFVLSNGHCSLDDMPKWSKVISLQ